MLYCTKCGSDLKGSKVRCPVCGYEVMKMKMDLSQPREVRKRPDVKDEPKPWAPPIPDQREDDDEIEVEIRPARPRVKAVEFQKEEEEEVENDPRYVDGCSVCGSTPKQRCFFTLSPICDRHTVFMQIYIRGMAFGERVPASPDIAAQKEGRPPTKAEAEEAGMFFAIKPYHEWKRVRK
jgi:hypothetical protein